jgi:mRNA-degrading endonuclease toxin of MazEF toxin-antitoxin module
MTEPGRSYPLRGEIWWVHFSFDPPDKNRLAVIVSPNGRNTHPRALTVLAVPLSTSINKTSPAHMILRPGETGLREDCVAWAESVGTIARDQLRGPVAGHRPLTGTQICRLAGLVKLAMGCVD